MAMNPLGRALVWARATGSSVELTAAGDPVKEIAWDNGGTGVLGTTRHGYSYVLRSWPAAGGEGTLLAADVDTFVVSGGASRPLQNCEPLP